MAAGTEKPIEMDEVRPESQQTLTTSNASASARAASPEGGPATKDEEAAQPEENNNTHAELAPSDDPNAVGWDGPDDPNNPLNWSMTRKWSNIGALSLMTLLT